jgi:hypothetical protein
MISVDSPVSTPPSVPYGRTETYANKLSQGDRNEYRGSDGTLLYVEELYMDSTNVANGYPVDAKGRRHGQFIHFEENGEPKEKCDYVHDLQHGMSEEYINGTLTRTTSYMNGERNGPLVLMAGGSAQTYYYLDDQEIEDENPKQIWEREKARVEAQ